MTIDVTKNNTVASHVRRRIFTNVRTADLPSILWEVGRE
jgi:hypothetical protein